MARRPMLTGTRMTDFSGTARSVAGSQLDLRQVVNLIRRGKGELRESHARNFYPLIAQHLECWSPSGWAPESVSGPW